MPASTRLACTIADLVAALCIVFGLLVGAITASDLLVGVTGGMLGVADLQLFTVTSIISLGLLILGAICAGFAALVRATYATVDWDDDG